MKTFATVFCCVCFALGGIGLALNKSDPNIAQNQVYAATGPRYVVPQVPIMTRDTCPLDIPETPVRGFAEKERASDTVYIHRTDTVIKQVPKVKVKKVPVPSNVIEVDVPARKVDTIQVPVYYLATQVGTKEGSKDQCIPIYEVHKVDELCPEIINSSVESSNESNGDVGE